MSKNDSHLAKSQILEKNIDLIWDRISNRKPADEYETDLRLLHQYLKQAREMQDIYLITHIWNTMGVLHENQGMTDLAFSAYRQSLEISRSAAFSRGEICGLLNIANIFASQGKLAEAVEQTLTALALLKSAQDLPEHVTTYYGLTLHANAALNLIMLVQVDEAVIHVKASHELLNSLSSQDIADLNLEVIITNIYFVRAKILIHQQDYKAARVDANLALELAQSIESYAHVVSAYMLMTIIALYDPEQSASPDLYWDLAEKLTNELIAAKNPSLWLVGQFGYLLSVDIFMNLGQLRWASRCVKKAIDVFNAIGDTSHLKATAVQLLQKLES